MSELKSILKSPRPHKPIKSTIKLNKEENYGILLANMIGFDKDIIDKAKEFAVISHENFEIYKIHSKD